MPLCLACSNAGFVIVYRLLWKRRDEDGCAVPCSRRVDSEEEGRSRMAELDDKGIDAEIVSGARPCDSCRRKEQVAARMERKKQAVQAKRTAMRKRLAATVPPAASWYRSALADAPRDWKMAAAGDRG